MKKAMWQRFVRTALLTGIILSITSISSAQIVGTIEKVWVEYGVKVKGVPGIRIHTKFSLKNALNADCAILANIQRADGGSFAFDRKSDPGPGFRGTTTIGTSYNTYATKDGKAVLMSKPFTSPYDRADYADTTLFFPDWAFQLRGDNTNKMKLLVIISSGGKEFVRSAIIEFSRPMGK